MDLQSMKFAHDLKMPIQLIYSCVQMLEMELSPNAKAEGYLQMLVRSADQLQGMVSSALAEGAHRSEEPRLRIRDVVGLARDVSRRCAAIALSRDKRLHFETNAARFRMPMDGEKLERMLDNLIANALRFAAGHVGVSVWVRGDAVDFIVSDDGCGVAEDMRLRIFELGVTDGGQGYGLAIVKEYARLLGGDVFVEDAPGGGSRFTLRLPVLPMAREDAPGEK